MTRKHYVIIATAIAQAYAETKTADERRGIDRAIEHISHALQIENPQFRELTFKKLIRTVTIQMSYSD
jgi:hypothetical protein